MNKTQPTTDLLPKSNELVATTTQQPDAGTRLTDEEKHNLVRLAWRAGRAAQTPKEKQCIEKALMLAVSEGWNAEDDSDIDFMYASLL
jgi:hypothetical protein